MRITFIQATKNVSEIANRAQYDKDVLYELLAAYGRAASAITKLREGVLNLAEDQENEVLQRGVVFFKHVHASKILTAIESMKKDPLVVRYNPRYLIVTDYSEVAAMDTKKGTTLNIKLQDIDRHVDFFYGWTGDEVTDEKTEAIADRRAAEKMTALYDEILKVNKETLTAKPSAFRHNLNVFFSRLLFCFFAEDTKVFSRSEAHMFTNVLKDYTQTDGSDLHEFLQRLFEALDVKDKEDFPSPFSQFPYVNGGLFSRARNITVPRFNPQARKIILECGSLNWADINPDIFGSMFQGVVDEEHRSAHGQHYTSVPNIMKTIEPLFLDELREELDKNYDNIPKLFKLLQRISLIRIFDPACGSGNFLIITYKELRKIEHAILERIMQEKQKTGGSLIQELTSSISLNNFYGIEIDDFAHEIAVLSLYLAKHQMNIEFEERFGKAISLIPLKDAANIVHDNAARLAWEKVCPNNPLYDKSASHQEQEALFSLGPVQERLVTEEQLKQKKWPEIYLIGNPPYVGRRNQNKDQKSDMDACLSTMKSHRSLDYIAIWFYKGARYIEHNENSRLAFVSTNSISQGEQVAILWPHILNKVEIGFAYSSFKWTNNAANAAGVTVVIISLRPPQRTDKYIFDGYVKTTVNQINPYLNDAPTTYIERRSRPISQDLPQMSYGNLTGGCDALTMAPGDKEKIVSLYPQSEKLFRRLVGSAELNKGITRYCLWIMDEDLSLAKSIPPINERIEEVRRVRSETEEPSINSLANRPHQFRDLKVAQEHSIIVPIVFSERRKYIPCDILPADVIIPNSAQAVYDGELYVFAILSSYMHMQWVRVVAGQLETRIRYSSTTAYNNFPVPRLKAEDKAMLSLKAREILFARQNHSEKNLAEMYDPESMPPDLRKAHLDLDLAVDRLYRTKPYDIDEERLSDLFALYEEMTAKEKVGAL
jgi:hypothetical protein